MKNKWFNKALSALLALVLCIGMVPATAIPAAAASSVGSNEWVVRNDDFSRYPTGEDTFWKNAWYTGFSSSYHSYTLVESAGHPEGTIYGQRGSSSYNIVEEGGNKVLELVSRDMCATRFTGPTISGAYSMTMDLYMPKSTGKSVPGVMLNLGYKGVVYIDGGDGVRLMNVGLTSPDYYVKDGTQKKAFEQNKWYTVKMSVEPGKFTVKFWARGEQEPADDSTAGVFVFEDNVDLTAEKLSSSSLTPSITTRSRGTTTSVDSNEYIVRIDNLKITKPYASMTLAAVSGQVGQQLAIKPAFTGQDLMAQQPAPKFSYTMSNSALGRPTPGGYLALNGAGQGTVTAELLTMDGEGTGATASAALTVTASTAGEQPLRILSIGNGYSRDTFYYLDKLAALVGEDVDSAYLSMTDATLRYHARNVAKNAAEYSYYADAAGGTATTSTINDVVEGENWDIIVLQQGVEAAGMNNTFAGDLRYLLDYLADAQPNAKVYWNMNAANQQDTQNRRDYFDDYYDGSQAVMYNAIVGCLDMFIVGEDAEYAADFDGWFPTGAAIQNARATVFGDTLTRDGYQLSLQAGRLTAAMTVLKVLFPEADFSAITASAVSSFLDTDKTDLGTTFSADPAYTNDDTNMALIQQSVADACADLTKAPDMLDVTIATVENTTPDSDDVTIGQVAAPLNLRFADIVVTKDGTIYAGAYESVTHVPARETLPYTEYCPEGYGRLKIWKGSADGKNWDFDNPVLTIDQHELQDWGISPNLYNRYELLKTGVQDYAFFNDARDANLGLMYYDMDGNGTEDEVLLFTFFCNDYNESGTSTFTGTHLLFSIDGGETWSKPQRITSAPLGHGGGKRGDIAVFSDGQILFPMYAHPKVSGVLLQWNVETQHWDTIADTEIPNYVPEKTTDFTEPAFIAPDPDGDIVYGFVRDNGQAVISYDRGRSWEHIHTIDGNVQQPGWAYIDENRAFATWSFANGPARDTKGQMVYFDAGWDATLPEVVHYNYYRTPHDAGDPSSKLLQNGKLLTIMYDVTFRAINGKFLDPDAPQFQLPELNDEAAQVTLQEITPDSVDLTVNDLPDTHTLDFTATFAAGGKLAVTAANGAEVELAAGQNGIRVNKEIEVRIAVINGATYTKVWVAGNAEPSEWTAVDGGTSTNSGKAVFAGSGVTLGDVTVTRRASMTMGEGGTTSVGMEAKAPLVVNPVDMAEQVEWTVSDDAIASVDEDGVISFRETGEVTVTATLGDKSLSVAYTVMGVRAEITGEGEKRVIFSDDFESYTVGENTFFNEMASNGYFAPYSSAAQTGYNIVQANGNKYLQLVSKDDLSAWCVVNTDIVGDYTAQFDFYQVPTNTSCSTFVDMWNNAGIYSMMQMGANGFNTQHVDAVTGNYVNSPEFASHQPGAWYTMKLARVDGGMYAKVWLQGTAEPTNWQYSAFATEMDTDNLARFRFSINSREETEQTVWFDNLIITKQRADVGDQEWIVRSDDFNNRTVGQDKFWNDSKYGGFSSSYRSYRERTGGSSWWPTYTTYYSRYNIVEESGDKMVELLSTYKVANYFTTTKVTGAYSTTMDLYMPTSTGSSVPGVVLNPFVGASPALTGSVQVYIDGTDGVRIRENVSTGAVQNHYITDAAGSKIPFKLDSWYTVKVSVAPGEIMVKMWARGGQEPADNATSGVLVFDYDAITEEMLHNGMSFSVLTRNRDEKNVNYIVRLDNLKISKPYDSLGMPSKLQGYTGDTVTLAPAFTGQSLMGQQPQPQVKYTSSDSGVASVTSGGVVTLGTAGEATISVELLDMDGKSHGVTHTVAVTVTAKAEQPDEPDVPVEPDEPEEPSATLGTFSLEVINTLIINGEKVEICRWVWTPLNKQ